jgi:hypothetical protein
MLLDKALHVRVVHEILFVCALSQGALAVAALLQCFRFAERMVEDDAAVAALVAAVQRREVDPLTAADRIVSSVLREGTS